jgi:hypothetical protein
MPSGWLPEFDNPFQYDPAAERRQTEAAGVGDLLDYFMQNGEFSDVEAAIDAMGVEDVLNLISSFREMTFGNSNRSANLSSLLGGLAQNEAHAGDMFRLGRSQQRYEQGVAGDKLGRTLAARGVGGGVQQQLQRDLSKAHSRATRGNRLGYLDQLESLGRSRSDAVRATNYSNDSALRSYEDGIALAMSLTGRGR